LHYFHFQQCIQQKRITNRRIELRITGALWAPIEMWGMWHKKHELGEEQLTWNHDQGGKFVTIRKQENRMHYVDLCKTVVDILKTLRLDFGAVDFIIDHDGNAWFLEINTRPGFTPLSIDIYVPLFKRLEVEDYEPCFC